MHKKFAVFDIDGTVIRWQLYHAIVHEMARMKLLPDEAAAKIKAARTTWKQRTHEDSFREYEHILVEAYFEVLSSIRLQDFDEIVERVFEKYKDQVYRYTRDLIRELKSQDYLLFAISGSQVEIVQKFAEYYGFDDFVGTVHARTSDGMLGEELSSPIYDKGKALQQLMDKHGAAQQGSYAVGDSKSDAAMLKLVEHPIAFNPERILFDIAKEQGWKVVVERKNMLYELELQDGRYVLR